MKFSMIFEAQLNHPSPEHEHQVILDCVEQAVLGDAMGFDRIWAVEHHALKWYAHMSAPETFLAYVAAKTERIRIGHGVVCMPFGYNHPVRAAERAAMLDILSGGRLDLGAGRGATLQEMSLCGVEPEKTYTEVEEALRMISAMWLEDEFRMARSSRHRAPSRAPPSRAGAPPPVVHGMHQAEHRGACRRVRHRCAGPGIRGRRRGRPSEQAVPRRDRQAKRRSVRLDRSQ